MFTNRTPPIYPPTTRLFSNERLRPIRSLIPPSVRRLLLSPISLLLALLLVLFFIFAAPQARLHDKFGYLLPSSLSSSTDRDGSRPGSHSSVKPYSTLDITPLPIIYTPYLPDLSLPPALTPHIELHNRLHAFLSRPILSHDEALTGGQSGSMRSQCPLVISDRLVNPDQFNGDGNFWRNDIGQAEIVEKRVEIVKWLVDKKVEEGERIVWEDGAGMGRGRGIVVTGGNQVRPNLHNYVSTLQLSSFPANQYTTLTIRTQHSDYYTSFADSKL